MSKTLVPSSVHFSSEPRLLGETVLGASLFKVNILPTTLVRSSFCIWLLSYTTRFILTALGCKKTQENAKFSFPPPSLRCGFWVYWMTWLFSLLPLHPQVISEISVYFPHQCIYLWQMELYWFDWESWLETVSSKFFDYSGFILNSRDCIPWPFERKQIWFPHQDLRVDPDAGFCPQCLNLTLWEHRDSSVGRMNVCMREHIMCLRGWDRVTRWGGATSSGMFTWICHCI